MFMRNHSVIIIIITFAINKPHEKVKIGNAFMPQYSNVVQLETETHGGIGWHTVFLHYDEYR